MSLKEAKAKNWRYVRGNWVKGWKLTQKGVLFARDVERRKLKKSEKKHQKEKGISKFLKGL